jgi:hypothetical protein
MVVIKHCQKKTIRICTYEEVPWCSDLAFASETEDRWFESCLGRHAWCKIELLFLLFRIKALAQKHFFKNIFVAIAFISPFQHTNNSY